MTTPRKLKRCYLVRHAQTSWNEENRIQGHSDLPLSRLGLEQAKCVGNFFARRHVQGIFTSGLARSRQTAEAIASSLAVVPGTAQADNGHQVQPVIHYELAEMHLGDWEGLTPQEVDARFNGAYQQWRTKPSSVVIPRAEPIAAFRVRVRRALESIIAQCTDGEYVVVSHGGVIAALLADLLGADYDHVIRRVRLDNAGITALELGTGLPHVLWINGTGHLEALSPAGEGWF